MIFQEKFPTAAEETLFCQGPVLEITEQIGGEEESVFPTSLDLIL
jgi:hypothetical protein